MTSGCFTKSSLAFLSDLKANNNRDWFQANKKTYQEEVEYPAKAFLSELSDQIGQRFSLDINSKLFRMYRDVRFSKDKTPYNAHIRMAFSDSAAKACGRAFYLSLEPAKVQLGAGCIGFDAGALESYRAHAADPKSGAALQETLHLLLQNGLRLEDPELKRIPRGYDKDYPHATLLRRKGLAIWHDDEPENMVGPDAIDFCLTQFERMMPLITWLERVG